MSDPYEISSRLVDDLVVHMPTLATYLGIRGHDHEWTDLSPDGHARLEGLMRGYRAELAPHAGAPDGPAVWEARVIDAWLGERIAELEHGDHLRDLNTMSSPFETFRSIFDIAPAVTPEDWQAICTRLETLDDALQGYWASLDEGRRRGLVAARRQVDAILVQAETLVEGTSAWSGLPERLEAAGHSVLAPRLDAALASARAAVARFAGQLRAAYRESASPEDGVGRDRYLRAAEGFLGLQIDPDEAYAWGWDEIARLRSEMDMVAGQIQPGATIREVADMLESEPSRSAPNPEAFRQFVQERLDRAVEELDGSHFDVDPRIRRLEVRLAPPGGALAAYYMQPSEDFSRPGSVWYPLAPGQVAVPLYQEVSTAYHEGFPGHHLQVGTSMAQVHLSRARRSLIWYSGYGEGWALYAERLMDELGFFERPEYRFGMLASQLFRACRVVVDIGSHLGLTIPAAAPIMAGERWDYQRAVRMMEEIGLQSHDMAVSEVVRYLGWPGQAISYKLGEREILRLRDELRRVEGADFELKDFHSRLLGAGEVRLDMLDEILRGTV